MKMQYNFNETKEEIVRCLDNIPIIKEYYAGEGIPEYVKVYLDKINGIPELCTLYSQIEKCLHSDQVVLGDCYIYISYNNIVEIDLIKVIESCISEFDEEFDKKSKYDVCDISYHELISRKNSKYAYIKDYIPNETIIKNKLRTIKLRTYENIGYLSPIENYKIIKIIDKIFSYFNSFTL